VEVIYRGFDGLDVSFAAQIPDELCKELEAAKQHAQEFRQSTPINWNGVRMLVAKSGALGGYSFLASTGELGATWFFKRPNARDPWGIRVSCNSFNLAANGLGGARSELHRTLELLGVRMSVQPESIGRVDYAVDFLAPEFVLSPDQFVMHSNANRADHIDAPEVICNGRSGRVTSVTIGKMPGSQVIIYDKRAEVIAKRKVGWWEIWNAARANVGLPRLNAEVPGESRVWRVELRAGKRHLKDRWNIKTWADLDDRFANVISRIVTTVRYADPTADSNRSRWPDSDLWTRVRSETAKDLFEMRQWTDAGLLKRIQKDAHDKLLAVQIAGLVTSRAALREVEVSDLPAFAIATGEEIAREIRSSPTRFDQKLTRAKGRYSVS
jgi:hypothetical protein